MLPAPNRMRSGADFRVAIRGGRRAGRPALVVHLARPEGASGRPRVGIVVSRAVGGAVVRNRVKRRLRAALRPILPRLPEGALLVVRANPASASSSWSDLERDLERSLNRVLADDARSASVMSSSGPFGRAEPSAGRGGAEA